MRKVKIVLFTLLLLFSVISSPLRALIPLRSLLALVASLLKVKAIKKWTRRLTNIENWSYSKERMNELSKFLINMFELISQILWIALSGWGIEVTLAKAVRLLVLIATWMYWHPLISNCCFVSIVSCLSTNQVISIFRVFSACPCLAVGPNKWSLLKARLRGVLDRLSCLLAVCCCFPPFPSHQSQKVVLI